MARVHPTALVDARAELADDVEVGPYTLIGPKVRIGAGSRIGAHCIIEGHTTLGAGNVVYPFCALGAAPQDKKYAGEETQLQIGNGNTIREYCSFNLGTVQGGGVTRLGDDNWIMAYVHLAHDCIVGNHTTFANNATLAGHVEIRDWVILGGFTGVHQFVRVGEHAITGVSSVILQDVAPFVTGMGNTFEPSGINVEGLKRRGFSAERIAALRRAFKLVFRSGLTLGDAASALSSLAADAPQASADLQLLAEFLGSTTRGLSRPRG
ncbi:MAG: acyl-ACP--UDP-N-acetylglucosamine O-acyltransferase [Betaproteobacteria bacterium]|nr:acyl-ACP--UDP-N-acetylglucosamine O-acyltransferase [Betaproteobacteria bacterium]